jgi:hypothetical protein
MRCGWRLKGKCIFLAAACLRVFSQPSFPYSYAVRSVGSEPLEDCSPQECFKAHQEQPLFSVHQGEEPGAVGGHQAMQHRHVSTYGIYRQRAQAHAACGCGALARQEYHQAGELRLHLLFHLPSLSCAPTCANLTDFPFCGLCA